MLTPSQIRGARAILDWTAQQTADKSGLSLRTVQRLEREGGGLADSLVKLQQTFERAGIEFIDENGGGPGVRLKKRGRK